MTVLYICFLLTTSIALVTIDDSIVLGAGLVIVLVSVGKCVISIGELFFHKVAIVRYNIYLYLLCFTDIHVFVFLCYDFWIACKLL